jgi:hypothetical protein
MYSPKLNFFLVTTAIKAIKSDYINYTPLKKKKKKEKERNLFEFLMPHPSPNLKFIILKNKSKPG